MRQRIMRCLSYLSCILCAAIAGAWLASIGHTSFSDHSLQSVQSSLSHIVPNATFDEVGLDDVLDFIKDITGYSSDPRRGPGEYIRRIPRPILRNPGIALYIDWNKLSAARVNKRRSISLKASNIPVGLLLIRLTDGLHVKVRAAPRFLRLSTSNDPLDAGNIERGQRFPWMLTTSATCKLLNKALPEDLGIRDEVNWKDLLSFVADTSHVPIRVDWTSLASAGIQPLATASPAPNFANCTGILRTALISGAPSGQAQFRVEDGYVQLASREEFDARDWPYRLGNWILAVLAAQIALITFFRLRKQGARGKLKLKLAARIAFCATVVASFMVGYFAGDPFEFNLFSNNLSVSSAAGQLRIQSIPSDPMTPYYEIAAGKRPNIGFLAPHVLVDRRFLQIVKNDNSFDSWSAQTSLPLLFTLTFVFPAWFAIRTLRTFPRRHRASQGRCPTCGYDLRATPDRCPECGLRISCNQA